MSTLRRLFILFLTLTAAGFITYHAVLWFIPDAQGRAASDPGFPYECSLSDGRVIYQGINKTTALKRCAGYALSGIINYAGTVEPITRVAKYIQRPVLPGTVAAEIVFNGICPVVYPPSAAIEWKGVVTTTAANVTSAAIPALLLKEGNCFAVTAVDTSGNESEKSNALCLVAAQ